MIIRKLNALNHLYKLLRITRYTNIRAYFCLWILYYFFNSLTKKIYYWQFSRDFDYFKQAKNYSSFILMCYLFIKTNCKNDISFTVGSIWSIKCKMFLAKWSHDNIHRKPNIAVLYINLVLITTTNCYVMISFMRNDNYLYTYITTGISSISI